MKTDLLTREELKVETQAVLKQYYKQVCRSAIVAKVTTYTMETEEHTAKRYNETGLFGLYESYSDVNLKE